MCVRIVVIDCDIYITGSNAKLLSGELATYLGGRYVEFVVRDNFPKYVVSYDEFDMSRDGIKQYREFLLAKDWN